MNVINLIPSIYERLSLFILVFTRISALFSTFIFFKRALVNARTMIALTTIVSFYVVMFYNNPHIDYGDVSINMLMQTVFQFLIGFIAGLILNIVFEVFTALGQIISTQIGLGMLSLIDPAMGSITSLTQFYSFTIALIFLLMNGHLMIIKTIIDSFTVLPVNKILLPNELITQILQYSSIIFSAAIVLSLSIIVAVFLTNSALALMGKLAPQFNLLSIGINMTLILGLICIYVTFRLFISKGYDLLGENLSFLHSLLGSMGSHG